MLLPCSKGVHEEVVQYPVAGTNSIIFAKNSRERNEFAINREPLPAVQRVIRQFNQMQSETQLKRLPKPQGPRAKITSNQSECAPWTTGQIILRKVNENLHRWSPPRNQVQSLLERSDKWSGPRIFQKKRNCGQFDSFRVIPVGSETESDGSTTVTAHGAEAVPWSRRDTDIEEDSTILTGLDTLSSLNNFDDQSTDTIDELDSTAEETWSEPKTVHLGRNLFNNEFGLTVFGEYKSI